MVKIGESILSRQATNIILDTYSRPTSWVETFFGEKSSESHRFKSIWEVDFSKTSEKIEQVHSS